MIGALALALLGWTRDFDLGWLVEQWLSADRDREGGTNAAWGREVTELLLIWGLLLLMAVITALAVARDSIGG
jgi:hypothetical protein